MLLYLNGIRIYILYKNIGSIKIKIFICISLIGLSGSLLSDNNPEMQKMLNSFSDYYKNTKTMSFKIKITVNTNIKHIEQKLTSYYDIYIKKPNVPGFFILT